MFPQAKLIIITKQKLKKFKGINLLIFLFLTSFPNYLPFFLFSPSNFYNPPNLLFLIEILEKIAINKKEYSKKKIIPE